MHECFPSLGKLLRRFECRTFGHLRCCRNPAPFLQLVFTHRFDDALSARTAAAPSHPIHFMNQEHGQSGVASTVWPLTNSGPACLKRLLDIRQDSEQIMAMIVALICVLCRNPLSTHCTITLPLTCGGLPGLRAPRETRRQLVPDFASTHNFIESTI